MQLQRLVGKQTTQTTLDVLPDVNLQPVGHQELDGVHVPTQMQRRVALVIRGQQIGPELVQQATYVHVAPGSG